MPEEKKPVITQLAPKEDSHGERPPVKCAFCDRPAVTIVKGYPVCQEHAEMLMKTETAPSGPAEIEAPKKTPESAEPEKL